MVMSAKSASPRLSSKASPSERVMSAQKWFLQREAVLDACKAPANTAVMAAASIQSRRRAAQDGAQQITKLLNELRLALLANETAHAEELKRLEASPPGAGSRKGGNATETFAEDIVSNWTAAVAEASGGLFRAECGLGLDGKELRLGDANGSPDLTSRRVQPLQHLLAAVRELRQLPAYKRLTSAKPSNQRGSHGSSNTHTSPTDPNSPIPSLVKGLQDALEESIRLLESGFAQSGRSAEPIGSLVDWARPLVRLTNECLQSAPLAVCTDEPRESLRRAAFDIESKQREQENAVTDGDMVRSEQLYFEKTALLEAMRPLYDTLEASIEVYQHDVVQGPLAQLQTLTQDISARQTQTLLSREQQLKRRALEDLERLDAQAHEVRTARTSQRAGMTVYLAEWERQFEGNRQQQESCLRAMEELEQRLRHLAEERVFLVEDRLECMAQERQREESAAAFFTFASKQEIALRSTLRFTEHMLHCATVVQEAVRQGCQRLGKHLHECIAKPAEEELLEVRKERLEHFRGLYLTLGELQFKKERHLEELDKRIEYFHAQQEIAMESFNPKAKEFSKAKKDLLEVKETMEQQVELISQKAQKQLEDFQPTERLLRASGVVFRHPVDDLAEMNARRKQKLLEYHSLMSTMNEKKESREGSEKDGSNDPHSDHEQKDGKKGRRSEF